MARKKTPTETKVESIRHMDKRTNIPTEELRDFIADDEQAPKTMLYPRDPSLMSSCAVACGSAANRSRCA